MYDNCAEVQLIALEWGKHNRQVKRYFMDQWTRRCIEFLSIIWRIIPDLKGGWLLSSPNLAYKRPWTPIVNSLIALIQYTFTSFNTLFNTTLSTNQNTLQHICFIWGLVPTEPWRTIPPLKKEELPVGNRHPKDASPSALLTIVCSIVCSFILDPQAPTLKGPDCSRSILKWILCFIKWRHPWDPNTCKVTSSGSSVPMELTPPTESEPTFAPVQNTCDPYWRSTNIWTSSFMICRSWVY